MNCYTASQVSNDGPRAEMFSALNRGERVQVDFALFRDFLEVLPPRFMGRVVQLCDGSRIFADFGYAEGDGVPVVAFWRSSSSDRRYFAQNSKLRTGA